MERIILIIKNVRNERLLKSELESRYTVITAKERDGLEQSFDMGIVDGPMLDEFHRRILLKRHAQEPLFLPFLLVTTRKDIGYATRHLWKIVDELIFSPIERIELQARIEILLRARRYSIQIKNRLEEIETFSHAIGHDLKGPLRAIKTFSSYIRDDCINHIPERCRDYLSRILANSERMEQMQDAIFTFMNTGCRGIVKEKVSLDNLINSTLEELNREIEKTGALININCSVELITDRTLLRLILRNLIENSLTYVDKDTSPEIDISCHKSEDYAIIEVSDNGIGIPEDKREEIFKPFVRLHSIEKYPGTGLGLSIVKKCAELLEGFVGVRPNREKGSTFWLRLPVR